MYPQNIGSDVKLDLLRRRISCHYVHVLINTVIARQETDSTKKVPPLTTSNRYKKKAKTNAIEKKLSYSQVGKHFQKIQTVIPESRCSGREDNIISEEQYRQMLLFKTEATVYLQQWGQHDSISEEWP